MKDLFCYSLFEQKGDQFDRSGHDPHSKQEYRYWSNLPGIYLINSLFYENFITRFYVHYDLMNHPLYEILDKLSQLENFEIEFLALQQDNTSPAYWRLKSLWDKDSRLCFCRDSDSLMCSVEARCVSYFIESDFWINNIRGIWQHNFEAAVLMAGLSGYRSDILRSEMPLPDSFSNYLDFCKYNHEKTEWGCDQINGVDFFVKGRSSRVRSKIIDFYIQPDFRRIDKVFWNRVKKSEYFNIFSCDESYLKNISLKHIPIDILKITDSVTGWLGQPVDIRGDKLNSLLSYNNDKCKAVKDILINNNILKKYYRVQ